MLDYTIVVSSTTVFVSLGWILLARLSTPYWRFRLQWSTESFLLIWKTAVSLLAVRVMALLHNQMDRTIIAVVLTTTLLTDYTIAARVHLFASMAVSLLSVTAVARAASLIAINDFPRKPYFSFH